MGIDELKDLVFNGELEDALIHIGQLSEENMLEGQIWKAFVFHRRGAYDTSISNINEVLRNSTIRLDLQYIALVIKAYSFGLIPNREQTNIAILNAEEILNKLSEAERKKILIWEGIMFHVKAMIAIEVYEDLALTEEYAEKSVRLKIDAGYEKECTSTINNLCLYYLRLGEVQKAQKSVDQLSDLVNKYFPSTDHIHSMTLFILGRIHQSKGYLNQALDYFNQALEISKLDLSIPSNLIFSAECYYSISQIFYDLNDYEKSLKHSIKAFVIQETQNNILYLSRTLFQLILITLKMNRLPQANSYLARLDTLIEKSDPFLSQTISAYHDISKALILLKDERTHSRAEAQKLFERLIQEYKSEYQIVILAHLNLCELLIEELKQYGNSSILEEIEVLLDKILGISEQTGSHALVGEILLLQAQIEFFQLKLQETNSLIERALNLASEKGLTRLEKRVLEVQLKIQDKIKTSVEVAKQAPELLEKLEKSQLIEYIDDMKKMVELMRTS